MFKPKTLTTAVITIALLFSSFATVYGESKDNQTITTAQDNYSVATDAGSFSLHANAKTSLTYTSSNISVASVSSKGVVTPRKKAGTATITIKAEETSQYAPAEKKIKVKVSKYKATSGKNIQSNSNYDRKKGDSSGRETAVRAYHYLKNTSYSSWSFIIRCTDPVVADKAATAARYIAANDNFGYNAWFPRSQSKVTHRAEIYKAIVKATGKNPSKKDLKKIRNVKKKADSSCTPTILAGYWLYYDKMSMKISLKWRSPYNKTAYMYYRGAPNVEYHQLEKAIKKVNRAYVKEGKLAPFKIIYIPKSKRASFFSEKNIKKNLKRGDIICSCPNPNRNGHTAIMQ